MLPSFVSSKKEEKKEKKNQNTKMHLCLSHRQNQAPTSPFLLLPRARHRRRNPPGWSRLLFPHSTLFSRVPSFLPPLGGRKTVPPTESLPIPRIKEKIYIKILTPIRSQGGNTAISLLSKQLSSHLCSCWGGCQENVGTGAASQQPKLIRVPSLSAPPGLQPGRGSSEPS